MNLKNKIFLILCYISSIIVGLLALPIILFQPMVFGGTFFIPIIPTFFLFCLGLMTYSCFNNFNIKDRTILLFTISISALISVGSYGLHYMTNSVLRSLMQTVNQIGDPNSNSLSGLTTILYLMNPNELPNIIIFIVIVFVAYNIFPIISLIKGKK